MSNFLAAALATTKPPLPHQQAAWTYAWDHLDPVKQKQFLEIFRSAPAPKPQLAFEPAAKLIREFEGFEPNAYPDSGTGGDPWTIGYGFTRWPNGTSIVKGQTITRAKADEMLAQYMETQVVPELRKTIPSWAALTQNQQCALVSFAWNVGWHFYGAAGFETITRCLAGKDSAAVPAALRLYCNPGSSVEAGLRRRREAEVVLWGIAPAVAKFTPASPYSYAVTPHVTYGELCNGEQRRRFKVQGQCDIAVELCKFLEKVRTTFDRPIIITSGHRPPDVNAEVGGASNSEHLYKPGCGAVDFYVDGEDIYTVQEWCDRVWPYSLGYGAAKGFVHLGIRDGRPKVRWDY